MLEGLGATDRKFVRFFPDKIAPELVSLSTHLLTRLNTDGSVEDAAYVPLDH